MENKMETDVTTALTLVVPFELHNIINNVRKENDRAYPRWMPHINFIFPFIPVNDFEYVAEKLQSKLKDFGSFVLDLSEVGYFSQGKNATIHLKPNDDSQLKVLFNMIREALPDIAVKHSEFAAHLTLAQSKKSEATEKMEEIKKQLPDGVRFTVDKICLINRNGNDPFQIHTEIKLD